MIRRPPRPPSFPYPPLSRSHRRPVGRPAAPPPLPTPPPLHLQPPARALGHDVVARVAALREPPDRDLAFAVPIPSPEHGGVPGRGPRYPDRRPQHPHCGDERVEVLLGIGPENRVA